MSLSALRQHLSARLAPPRVGDTAAIPTGIAALDRALSNGGVPAGRLTEVLGARGSGRTTLVRQLVATAVQARRWVAVIDGSRTLVPREWAAAGASGRLWVIRPREAGRSAWCADLLVRSGAFSLVVLDGAPSLPRPVAIRLTRLAKERDVALVVLGEEPAVGSAVRLRVIRAAENRPAESRVTSHESRITIHVEKGGVQRAVEVTCVVDMARRLRSHPEVPDRRGVARRDRWGRRMDDDRGQRQAAGGPSGEPARGAAPKQRRFGEAAGTREQFIPGRKRQAPGARRRTAAVEHWTRRVTSHEPRITNPESRATP